MTLPLSKRGENIFKLAMEEARGRKKPFFGTAHVLIAILLEGKSATARALVKQEITLDYVRDQLDLASVAETKSPVVGGLSKSPDMEKVLELAVQEAVKLGDEEICPIHLLLAILRMEKCEAADIIRKLGADAPTLRKEAINAYKAKLTAKRKAG